MKKFFTLFCAVLASVGTMFADVNYNQVKIGDLYYNLTVHTQVDKQGHEYVVDRTAMVDDTKWHGAMYYADLKEAHVPASVPYLESSFRVIGMCDATFHSCKHLTTVTLPSTLSEIPGGAFMYCDSLVSITIPNTITEIGSSAFHECKTLRTIDIPSSVSTIGSGAFSYCDSLETITFHEGLTEIASSAFQGCKKLKSVTFPSTLIRLDYSVFVSCEGLTSIEIPGNITQMNPNCFAFCKGLNSVTWSAGMDYIPESTFEGCTSLTETSFTFNSTVHTIGRKAFNGCKGLHSFPFPSSVTTIGPDAFAYCSEITSIQFPDNLETIGDGAFGFCDKLPEIIIPNSVTYLGGWAFMSCVALASVSLGTGITIIKDHLFTGCQSLTSITIPDQVVEIENHAFEWNTNLESVNFGSGLQIIGNGAFLYCEKLKSVQLPESLTSLGEEAFMRCEGLEFITLSSNITEIKSSTFSGCYSLQSIDIPNSVKTIGWRAFTDCSHLTAVSMGEVTTLKQSVFNNCPLKRLTVDAATPPANEGANQGFDNTTCHLYVPAEAIDTYKATDWWKDFKSIREIGAIPLVTFLDWDGTVIDAVHVDYEEAAPAPADPTREGYTFTGWDKDFSTITEDLTVTALYEINQYYVEFRDWDNTLLKEETVDWNTAAVAPADPARDWYTFLGWDKDFSAVREDMVITARYASGRVVEYELLFSNSIDHSEIATKEIAIEFPVPPTIEGFTFVGWRTVAGMLDDGIEIEAVYYANTPTSAPDVVTNPSNPAQKLIREGNVYILTSDKIYTVTGQKVK